MEIFTLTPGDTLWDEVRRFADACSWRAGSQLAKEMAAGYFTDWERVFAAVDDGRIAGYCTVSKTDCIPGVPYTPYIGFVFVTEAFRGHRLSQRLLMHAMAYLKTCGFDRAYLVSDHVGLYEKYGFTAIDRKPAPWGAEETIFMHTL